MTRLNVSAEKTANKWLEESPFGDYLGAEQSATSLRVVGGELFVPGLLQTDSMATAIDRWAGSRPENIGAQVSLRLRRQRIFDSLDDGGAHFFLPEVSITSNPMGADTNMQRHLIDDLLTRSARGDVLLRILPAGTYTAQGSSIHEAANPDGVTVYTEEWHPDTKKVEGCLYLPGDTEVARYSGVIDACGEAALSLAASHDFLEQKYNELGRD